MPTKTVTVELDAGAYEWLEGLARTSATSVSLVVASIVKDEQARAAMEAVAAWARDDDGAPTLEEVDRVRASMFPDDER